MTHLLRTGLICLFAALGPGEVGQATAVEVHGLSTFGDLKYGAGFRHFDYVNPDAPKGGEIRLRDIDSFDSVNPFILKGNPTVINGDIGGDLNFTFASLMTAAEDEAGSVYGLVARSAEFAPGKSAVSFHLRPEAVFHDGSPIRATDVAFTLETLKKEGHPRYRLRFADITEVTAQTPLKVTFHFRKGALTRDLPLLVATLPILSKKSFENRKFNKTTMVPFLGSGPYKMVKVVPGRSVTYARIENHWAENLPVHKGRYNFERIRVDYYRDRTIALEAFFAGEYDFREEFTSRSWMTEYDGKPAVDAGRIKRLVLEDKSMAGLQAFFINSRREQFRDVRVRKAFSLLFDYEWTNKNLFYGQYDRLQSIFENSGLAARELPSKEELDLLTPWSGQIPAEVFSRVYKAPMTEGDGNIRKNLRKALGLLKQAGYRINNRKMTHQASGRTLTAQFLLYEQSFTRIINPFIRNLKRAGIEAKVRVIDAASWQNRIKEFDFDIIVRRLSQPENPGVELRDWWGSPSADITGGLNISGVKNPAVDALIEAVIKAETRTEMTRAARALDRVLMWQHYLIPQWFTNSRNIAFWDKFGKTEQGRPGYSRAVLSNWWYDPLRARKLELSAN